MDSVDDRVRARSGTWPWLRPGLWAAPGLCRWLGTWACALSLVLTACQLSALDPGKPLRGFGQRSWQSDAGLPQNTVHAVAQTRDGYLWIGTEAGLVRFDGVDFRIFDTSNTPGLPGDAITALEADDDGGLWIGTQAGLARELAGQVSQYGDGAAITCLYRARDGHLIVLTSHGAATVAGGRLAPIAGTDDGGLAGVVTEGRAGQVFVAGAERVIAFSLGTAGARQAESIRTPEIGAIRALAVGLDGELWVGGSRGLQVLGTHAGQAPRQVQGLPSNEVTALVSQPDGSLAVGTAKGLALVANGLVRVPGEFRGMRVDKLFLDHQGALWVATGDGLARVAGGRVEIARHAASMPAGVLSIFEDREGSMWFGTESAGLHVMRDQAFSTVSAEDGLTASVVRAIFEDHAGTMWLGTSGGGLDRLDRTSGTAVQAFARELPSRVVLSLAETKVGAASSGPASAAGFDLWVGTPEGLARIRNKHVHVYTTADGLADDFVRSLYADHDGSLWIGTRNGLTHLNREKFHSYTRLDGLAGDLVGAMLRTRTGELYVGTLGGLSRLQGEGFVDVSPRARAKAPGAVTALLEDHAGSLWVASQGSGLGRLRDGQMATLPAARAAEIRLPETIYGLLEDGEGRLWLSSRTGIDRLRLDALNAAIDRGEHAEDREHYGVEDGMRISEASGGGHPAAWRAQDGGLWFATLEGAVVTRPSSSAPNRVPPLVAIEQVLVDTVTVPVANNDRASSNNPQGKQIEVAPGHGRLTIRYAGLSFVAPQKVTFRYRLQGFDKAWVEAGSRRTAFYTNVPPGKYQFEVMAANNSGIWSVVSAQVHFRVAPFLYQTWWFVTLVLAALAMLGYLGYRDRVLTVERQYQAVLEERGRIAREIHDTLAQGYVAIGVQLELAERLLVSSADAAAQQLRQTRSLVREGLEEARSSIWNLRAQADAGTLPAQIASRVEAAKRQQRSSPGPVFKFAVHGAYRAVARNVEGELVRIAQEAMANAIAHAHAHLVTVTITYAANELVLRVADDGVGLENASPERGRRHFGLEGMRERAARIGAELAFSNGLPQTAASAGPGTAVNLRLDLRSATEKMLKR